MRVQRLLKIIAAVFVVVAVAVLLRPVLRSPAALASVGPGLENITVLCSSCSFPGLPQEGHLILMDTKTGDIWAYGDRAIIGQAKPVYMGTLAALGQPVVKKQ